MNTRGVVSVEKIVEDGRVYRLDLPMGAAWEEAEKVSKELYEEVVKMRKLADEKAKEQEEKKEEEPKE